MSSRIGKEPGADSACHDQLVIPVIPVIPVILVILVILVIDADIAQHGRPTDPLVREERALQPGADHRAAP